MAYAVKAVDYEDVGSLHKKWITVAPFVNNGGLCGMSATCMIQPVDIVKVRIQVNGGGHPFGIARSIVQTEGFMSLYTGLSAGLLRQATYGTARLGIHSTLVDHLKKRNEKHAIPFWQKVVAGLTAGGLGAVIGSPADLSLVRMQADQTLPLSQRRHYTGVGHALSDIVRNEGFRGLFRGATSTAMRAMALNVGMLATNDQAKEVLAKDLGVHGFSNTFGAAAIAGFFASSLSLPFDFVKTQLQKQTIDPISGKFPYNGVADCFGKTFALGGLSKFYAGFPTYYFRIAPHTMLTLIFLDKLKSLQTAAGL